MGKTSRRVQIGIYKLTNKTNGKMYIGQSTDIYRRWNKHKTVPFNKNSKSYDLLISRAIRKHGVENFTFEIIEECGSDKLNEREIYWIAYYHTYINDPECNGYNQTEGGEHSVKFPTEKVLEIIDHLENSELSMNEISKKLKVSFGIVSEINAGKAWHQEGREYPIRTYTPPPKTIKHCAVCGKALSYRTATLCRDCFKKEQAKNQPSKEKLLYLILRYPIQQVGEQFGVDGNAVRKWCKKHQLPYAKNDIKQLREKLGITEFHIKKPEKVERDEKYIKKVRQYDKNGNFIKQYASSKQAAENIIKEVGLTATVKTIVSKISECCNGKQKTAYGYKWQYAS